jgi:hypothetical protein
VRRGQNILLSDRDRAGAFEAFSVLLK